MGEKLEGRKANGKKGLRRDRLDWLKGWREARHEGRKAGGEKVAKGKSGHNSKTNCVSAQQTICIVYLFSTE